MRHKIKHWLNSYPCEVVEIVHEDSCAKHDIEKRCCHWAAILRCTECGEVKVIK